MNQGRADTLKVPGGLALAERLGTNAVVFPGGHGGFESHPVEFAEKLHTVLGGN